MPNTFAELYAPLLKSDVFVKQARQNIERGADGLTCALAYAEQGKPEFTLAYLLLIELTESEKREILATSFEQRAAISNAKADEFDSKFNRPFPLIKVEAQKDRLAANQVRLGRRVRRETRSLTVN